MTFIRRRTVTNKIRWFIDNILPPIISDSRWFNLIIARVMFGNCPFDLDFKEKVLSFTSEELESYYNEIGKFEPYREADVTPSQVEFVTQTVVGPRILDIGCGNGELAVKLAQLGFEVTACDLKASRLTRLEEKLSGKGLNLHFQVANTECLPWLDASFDTVVSTHTLEHILNLSSCLEEILRIARRRVIIIVPCQKYKKYTIDTHINFFPTESVLRWSLRSPPSAISKKLDGDWAIFWEVTNNIIKQDNHNCIN